MKINCSYTELVPLEQIIPNPKNPNNHPERQIELLSKILAYQGQRLPIIVSKRSGFIVSGHGRLMAIQKLGWEKAAVDFQDFESEAQEYSHMIADNKIQELADHDDLKMKEEIQLLGIDDFELLGLDDFNLHDGDLGPGDESDQGKLDELVPQLIECYKCHGVIDMRKAKKID